MKMSKPRLCIQFSSLDLAAKDSVAAVCNKLYLETYPKSKR